MITTRKIIGLTCSLVAATVIQAYSAAGAYASPALASGDADIGQKVRNKLNGEAAPRASDIQVAASGGEVRLTGLVDTDRERREAGAVAAGVSGVRVVVNGLAVDNGG